MDSFNYKKCGIVIVWIGGKILLSERLKGQFKGRFGVAGGKIENNEDIVRGACREFQEETGAYLYYGHVKLIDCYILPKTKNKVFIYESILSSLFAPNIKDTEPTKHGKWHLYTKKEALKLNLMPYIKQYLKNINPKDMILA